MTTTVETLSWDRIKDPDEVLDYQINWADDLALADTIATSTWTSPAGITQGADEFSDTVTTVWLSGGTDGNDYTVVNRITTDGGRTMERSVILSVRSR